jgi:hypothetical protein
VCGSCMHAQLYKLGNISSPIAQHPVTGLLVIILTFPRPKVGVSRLMRPANGAADCVYCCR